MFVTFPSFLKSKVFILKGGGGVFIMWKESAFSNVEAKEGDREKVEMVLML